MYLIVEFFDGGEYVFGGVWLYVVLFGYDL